MMNLQEAEFYHLIAQGIGSRLASSEEAVKSFFALVLHETGMTPLGPAQIYKVGERQCHDDSGVTGFQAIMESHISVHTWPEWRGLVVIDIFSCKWFDIPRMRKVIEGYWGFDEMDTLKIDRNYTLNVIRSRSIAH